MNCRERTNGEEKKEYILFHNYILKGFGLSPRPPPYGGSWKAKGKDFLIVNYYLLIF
jgi:hypothetical protein